MSLIIRKLSLANVGVLRGRIDLGEFVPGINMIVGQNETGKSTAVNALRCALFEKHNARHAGIRALQPHNTSLAPEIWVDFSVDTTHYTLHKRFLSKASAVLTVGDDETYEGEPADERLRACLGSRRPGNRGASREDMGLWGLLWVSQDEAAFSDPGAAVGDETRGALQEIIGRQVGQIVGGRHGERLRTRALEEARRYWTAAAGQPTGELLRARQRCESAREQVAAIEAAVAQVEDEADHHASLQARLEEVRRERPHLEAEQAQAQADSQAAEALQHGVQEARQAVAVAQARSETAQQRIASREALIERAETIRQRLNAMRTEHDEMQQTLATRNSAAATAAEQAQKAEATRTAARRKLAAAAASLKRAQQSTEARRLVARRDEARRLGSDLQERRHAADKVLDETAYARLAELDEARRTAAARLAAEGSRLTVEGDRPLDHAFGRACTVEIPDCGPVHLVPAREELGKARDALRDATAALHEALTNAGVESLELARERRQQRAVLEDEEARLRPKLAAVAPEGLEPLAEAAAKTREALERDRQALTGAENANRRLTALREELGKLPVDEETHQRIERLARAAELAAARLDAIGTGVEIRALRPTTVAAGDEPPTPLDGGRAATWSIAKPTRLTVGDVAEVQITPGGDGLEAAEISAAETRAELEQALGDAGIDSLEQAREQAQRWLDTRAGVTDAHTALKGKAPEGLEILRQAVIDGARRLEQQEQRLAEARSLRRRLEYVREKLGANPVEEAAMAQLEKRAAAATRTRKELTAVAARIRFGGESNETQMAAEKTTGALPDGRIWTLIPGHGGAEADAALDSCSRDLKTALAAARVETMAQATEQWRRGLALAEKIRSIEARLTDLAPDGLDALEAAAADLDRTLLEDPPADLDQLTRAENRAREDLAAAETRCDEDGRAAARAATELAAFRGELMGKKAQLEQTESDARSAAARLATAREETPDPELTQRGADAATACREAEQALQAAEQALADATPQLLKGERDRARYALEKNRADEQRLLQDMSAARAILDRAAAEGRFEQLAERRVELAEAEDALQRVQRAADAAKLLEDHVNTAYKAAQARFLRPVVDAARPYLTAIRPGTEIRMTPNLTLDRVVRRGTEEDFSVLSGGTREQLSVIVRLALARVLAADTERTPLPLILDDTMGWTDDRRFVQMVRILHEAANQFQIIVLTCHPDRFARFKPGRLIELDRLKREATATDTP